MTIPTDAPLYDTVKQLQNLIANCRGQGTVAMANFLATGAKTAEVWAFCDQINRIQTQFNTLKAVTGLNAYATTVIPGYAGTATTDITTIVNAAKACNDWIYANFPKETQSGSGYIEAEILNPDCSRGQRQFTPTDLVPLRALLQTFLNALG